MSQPHKHCLGALEAARTQVQICGLRVLSEAVVLITQLSVTFINKGPTWYLLGDGVDEIQDLTQQLVLLGIEPGVRRCLLAAGTATSTAACQQSANNQQ